MRTNDVKALRNPETLPPQFDLLKQLLRESVAARARVADSLRRYNDIRGKAMRDTGCTAAEFDALVNRKLNRKSRP